jgi:glycosyltransferase involved in cell wall biosynthesis
LKRFVVMVGPALDAKGGIASVCAAYRDAGLFETLSVRYLTSFVAGSGLAKLRVALTALGRLLLWLLLRRVALVHVHMAAGSSVWRKLAFCALAGLARVPFVVHLHSGKFPTFFDEACGPRRQALVRAALRRSGALLYLSGETGAWLRARRLVSPRMHLMPNPAPCADAPHAALATELPQRLLFLGRLEEAKGLSVLVEAFAGVLQTSPQAELWLGGEGDRARYAQRLEQLGVAASRVRFLGWVGDAEKAALWPQVQVFVLPSRFEGQPMGVLEAMGQGVPVVATRVGGVPDVVHDGADGLLVPVDDATALAGALAGLLRDPARRVAMGRAAWATARARHAPAAIEAELARLYRQIAERRADPL